MDFILYINFSFGFNSSRLLMKKNLTIKQKIKWLIIYEFLSLIFYVFSNFFYQSFYIIFFSIPFFLIWNIPLIFFFLLWKDLNITHLELHMTYGFSTILLIFFILLNIFPISTSEIVYPVLVLFNYPISGVLIGYLGFYIATKIEEKLNK